MQNGKKPTREQKKVLIANNLDAREWLYIKEANNALLFRNRTDNQEVRLEKNR